MVFCVDLVTNLSMFTWLTLHDFTVKYVLLLR